MLLGWKYFFSSSWASFDARFKLILESLAKQGELLDGSRTLIRVAETKEWRSRAFEEIERIERERSIFQLQAVISWLNAGASLQEDESDAQLERCLAETSNWVTQNPKINAWMRRGPEQKVLWLKGKPGSGMYIHIPPTSAIRILFIR